MIDGAINQDPVWPISSLKLAADEVLLAVADRGSTSSVPRRVGRIVLGELAKAVRECPGWLQDGFVANGYFSTCGLKFPNNWPITRSTQEIIE